MQHAGPDWETIEMLTKTALKILTSQKRPKPENSFVKLREPVTSYGMFRSWVYLCEDGGTWNFKRDVIRLSIPLWSWGLVSFHMGSYMAQSDSSKLLRPHLLTWSFPRAWPDHHTSSRQTWSWILDSSQRFAPRSSDAFFHENSAKSTWHKNAQSRFLA